MKAAGAKRLILSHLPEEGDYDLLKAQAQKQAGENIQVSVAKIGDTYQI